MDDLVLFLEHIVLELDEEVVVGVLDYGEVGKEVVVIDLGEGGHLVEGEEGG